MIITVARECGSNGHLIGELVAKKLGIEFYDRKTLIQMAKDSGGYDEFRGFFEERQVNSLLYSLARRSEEFFPSTRERHFLKRLTKGKSFVIMEVCSNYIFRDDDATSVFIHAQAGYKVKEIERRLGYSEEKAKNFIKNTDLRRKEFHNYYTGEFWGEGKNYNLCIDSTQIDPEFAADMIVSYVNAKQGKEMEILTNPTIKE